MPTFAKYVQGLGPGSQDASIVGVDPRVVYRQPIGVLFLIDELVEMGGAERACMRLIRDLPTDRFRPSVITFKERLPQAFRESFTCPLEVLPLGRTYDWNALHVARQIRRHIRQQNVKIVHTFFETSDLWGGMVAKSTGRICLISGRRDMGILRTNKHRIAYRQLRDIFDRVVTVSEAVRKCCIEEDRLAPERVVTVHNGIDDVLQSARPRGAVRNDLGLQTDDLVVTAVGHIRHIKGFDLLIRAARELIPTVPKLTFLVVGDVHESEHYRDLQQMLQETSLARSVRFVGPREDVPSILAASDVFLLPSRSEGFSNALIEAMICALPCVATDVGGNREAVCHGSSGYLIARNSVKEMVDALALLLTNTAMREHMGAESRRIALEKFTQVAMVRSVVSIYESALDQREFR